ncbi:Scr1 family TA system antitoxin-like transcriptional regulator [Saccharothrix isguenensis]
MRRVNSPPVRGSQAAKAPNVTIQVLPFTAGAHPGMPGRFVVMDFQAPDSTGSVSPGW